MAKEIDLLVDVLQQRAQSDADKLAFIYLEQGEEESERLTFAELDRTARQIADCLLGVSRPGERALLIYPSGLDFVKAFYGCLYAGVIPIPTNKPGRNRSVQRLQVIGKDSQASMCLTTPEFLTLFRQQIQEFPEFNSLKWVSQEALEAGSESSWRRPEVDPESIAFIQYTSGSTRTPRGVVINYQNLSCNKDMIREGRGAELTPESIMVNWPPQFHDMGLIAGVIQGVFDAHLSVLISPIAFMQRPTRWLEAITKYRGTFSGGPNFAYELCVRKVTDEELLKLDLSSWKTAFNSAEPIRVQTQDLFVRKFSACGFEYEAFHPCYGLADATLVVSGYGGARETLVLPVERTALEEGKVVRCEPAEEINFRLLVNCGQPLGNAEVVIVDPLTRERCEQDRIGEIWVSGDNIGEGYWNRPEDTEIYFQARIKNSEEGPFLRTGDLGFMQDGDLYVTGRYKDMIIVRGRNYYPQDIEFTVEKCHPAMQLGGGAAFRVTADSYEQLVVVQELKHQYEGSTDLDDVIKGIRLAIAREHGIRASTIILIRRGTIPKTSSGKIMRYECYNLFVENKLKVLAEWRAPTGM